MRAEAECDVLDGHMFAFLRHDDDVLQIGGQQESEREADLGTVAAVFKVVLEIALPPLVLVGVGSCKFRVRERSVIEIALVLHLMGFPFEIPYPVLHNPVFGFSKVLMIGRVDIRENLHASCTSVNFGDYIPGIEK